MSLLLATGTYTTPKGKWQSCAAAVVTPATFDGTGYNYMTLSEYYIIVVHKYAQSSIAHIVTFVQLVPKLDDYRYPTQKNELKYKSLIRSSFDNYVMFRHKARFSRLVLYMIK